MASVSTGRWFIIPLVAVALLAGVAGMTAGALLIPRTEVVEKPVEVLVEKRVEVPVEKQIIVERKIELPPAPLSYQPTEGGARTATNDEIRIALLVRDEVRKADDAEKVEFEAGAIFKPGKNVKVFLALNDMASARLSRDPLRSVAVKAMEASGFTVLAEDAASADWNTLVHVEVELTDTTTAGRISVTVRQGLMGFSNGGWKKVNVGVAHYGKLEELGPRPQGKIEQAVSSLALKAAADLAKAR